MGGTLGNINWFHGKANTFYGLSYRVAENSMLFMEYNPDEMIEEKSYMQIKSPYNFGAKYKLNNFVNLSAQYLHGSQVSFTAEIKINPAHPPLKGGNELAPVPMRLRGLTNSSNTTTQLATIEKVLLVDGFKVHQINIEDNIVKVNVTNTKFRSTAQAVGRISSTLQRFTSDNITTAFVSFHSNDLQIATSVDLDLIINEQLVFHQFQIAITLSNLLI